MKFSKIVSTLLMLIMVASTFSTVVLAVSADETEMNSAGGVAVDGAGVPIPAVITEPSDKEFSTGRLKNGVLVHEEEFKVDSFLKGENAKMEATFNVGEWVVNEVELTLVYSASQFIDETKSSFTVLLNGVRCVTEKQPSTFGERGQIKLTLPASELKLGINTVSVEADILTVGTLEGTAGSIESGWFNVFKDSTIAIAYEPINQVISIKEFYQKFTSMESLDFKHSVVVSPTDPTNNELQNSMLVVSGTSKNSGDYFKNIAFTTTDTDNLAGLNEYKNIIYVAEYNRLPQEIKNMMSDEDKKQAEQSAVMSLVKSDDKNILIVTGTNEQAMENAAKLFANKTMMEQLGYMSKVVNEDQDFEVEPKSFEQYRMLTQTGTQLSGVGENSMNYYIDFPYNRSITDKSQIYLVFRYADNLDFDSSMMTVYLNETPVSSKKLSRNSVARDEVTFNIPNDIAVSGNFVIRVAFDLQTTGEGAPWAFVSPESTLKINWASQPFLVFENYPSPFIKDGTFNSLAVVLPEKPSISDLKVVSQTFCLFGQYLESNAGDITIVRDTEIFDITGKNVISVGTFAENKYTQTLNEKLFFKFSEDGKNILSNEKMLIDDKYGEGLGTVQLLESPSAKDNAILVMSGTSDKGLLKASSYLKTPDYSWKVFGDGFVTDAEKIYNFKFKEDNAKKLSIPSKLRIREDLTSLLIVLSLLGVMMVVSIVLMLVKYRKGGANNEK